MTAHASIPSVFDDFSGSGPAADSSGISLINAAITGSPSWLTELPTPAQSYFKSFLSAGASIINSDAAASATSSRSAAPAAGGFAGGPSHSTLVVMGVAAAAVLGLAAAL